MSCNTRYWCSIAQAQKDRPSNPALAKENNDGLKALIAAREAQDRALTQHPIVAAREAQIAGLAKSNELLR